MAAYSLNCGASLRLDDYPRPSSAVMGKHAPNAPSDILHKCEAIEDAKGRMECMACYWASHGTNASPYTGPDCIDGIPMASPMAGCLIKLS
jgi:hypothetical protein